jgi:hypothetical protein
VQLEGDYEYHAVPPSHGQVELLHRQTAVTGASSTTSTALVDPSIASYAHRRMLQDEYADVELDDDDDHVDVYDGEHDDGWGYANGYDAYDDDGASPSRPSITFAPEDSLAKRQLMDEMVKRGLGYESRVWSAGLSPHSAMVGQKLEAEGAQDFGLTTQSEHDRLKNQHLEDNFYTLSQGWEVEPNAVFKMDPDAECNDCIGGFSRHWKVDGYTGWAHKNYTYEKSYSHTEVPMTPLEKSLYDYEQWTKTEQAKAMG